MKEIIVISGKGGTGKTSILASLALLAKPVVVADCDVDAADLHLLLSPEVLESNGFLGGAKVDDSLRVAENVLRKGKAEVILTGGLVGQVFTLAKGFHIGIKKTLLLKN